MSEQRRWAQVETLFLEATELPPRERATFLTDRCGDDLQLREEVLSLLRYDSPLYDTGVEPPLLDALQASAASVVDDELYEGRMLGPYRIEHEVGRGGMSVVYLAARADGEFDKRVAIKLIKRGMDTSAVVGRLRRERRILATLEHPSIAHLLDGGTTPDGRPWIAMEYVEGRPIDRFCGERNLSIAERCLLIDKVCGAVAYAHRNLVVHLDLKPSNILIAPDGTPKLLDFGIAKLLTHSEEEDAGGPLTRGPSRPLTPEYASPEQLRGDPPGTAADVYSLGVVLYELLTGQRPAENAVKASAAALQSGKDARWRKRLRGDLDNILQMALRQEPERRYLTVEQMQADLRKHLAGLPVAARRETWWYRFGKFFRRHPMGAPAAVAVAIAAVAGVIVIARAEADAQLQRRKAEQRMGQLVELANRALINVHGSIERLPGATQARLEMVRTTLEYLDRLSAESGNSSNDARVLSALASAYTRMATVQGSPLQPNLGDLRGAEESYVKAGKILDSLITGGADNADVRLRDAELREVYGMLLSETGRKDEAMEQYRRGLDQIRIVLTAAPRNLEARKDNSRIHLAMGQITKYNDAAGTRRTDLELLPLYETLVREYPRDTDCLLDLASFWSQIGSTFEEESKPAEATEVFRRSAGLREQVSAMRPQDVTVQHDLLIAYGHLGDLTGTPMFPSLGDYREGVVWYQKALAIAQQMAAADRSNVQARNDEGTALLRIGASQTAAGEHRAALDSLQRAESFLIPLHNTSPASQTLGERVGMIYQYRGRALAALDDNVAAIEALRRSLDVCQAILRDHASPTCRHAVWTSQGYLALALVATGDTEAGLRESQDVLEGVKKNFSEPVMPVYRGRALAASGAVHVALAKRASADGRLAEWRAAADFYGRALTEWRAYPGSGSEPFAGEIHQAEAALALSQRASSQRALSQRGKTAGTPHDR